MNVHPQPYPTPHRPQTNKPRPKSKPTTRPRTNTTKEQNQPQSLHTIKKQPVQTKTRSERTSIHNPTNPEKGNHSSPPTKISQHGHKNKSTIPYTQTTKKLQPSRKTTPPTHTNKITIKVEQLPSTFTRTLKKYSSTTIRNVHPKIQKTTSNKPPQNRIII